MPIDLLKDLKPATGSAGPKDLLADYEKKQGVDVDPDAAPEPEYQPGTKKGFAGAFGGGIEQTGKSLGAFADVLQGDEEEIIEDAKQPVGQTGAQIRFMGEIEKNKDRYGDEDLWSAVKSVAQAAWEEPMGAAHETIAQLPNSGAVMGSAAAGAIAGSAIPGVGTGVGAIVGGIAGYLLGNTAIETGGIAREMGREGEVDTGKALKQGAIKGGVITAVDTATIALNRFMLGAPGKAAANAVEKIFGTSNPAAMRAAIQADPAILIRAKEAGAAAAANALPKGMKRGAMAGAGMALESASEGAGEYFGSKAAGLDASLTEAVMESLMSVPQSAVEVGFAETLGRKGVTKDNEQALQGLEGLDFVGPRDPKQFGPTQEGVPPDVPTTEGYGVEEIDEQVLATEPEPFPTAEGIDVGLEMGPIANLAGKFKERLTPGGMSDAPRTDIEEIAIDGTPVPRETEGGVEQQTEDLIKEAGFIQAEIDRRTEKAEQEEGIALIGAAGRSLDDREAEAAGLREDIDRRRGEIEAGFTAETPEGMTREQQVDNYIAASDQLDKEEKALDAIEKKVKAERDKLSKKPEKVVKAEPKVSKPRGGQYLDTEISRAKEAVEGAKKMVQMAKDRGKSAEMIAGQVEILQKRETALAALEAEREERRSLDDAEARENMPLPEVKELDPGVVDEVRPQSGKPFKTKKAALNARKIRKLDGYEVVEKDGGFVLQDLGKPPEAPTAEGIEVEELDKVPGPRPNVGKAPKRVPGGSQLRDALKGAGFKSLKDRIDELYPRIPVQAGGLPEDYADIEISDEDLWKLPPRQAGLPDDLDDLPAEPETDVDPGKIAGFLEREPEFPTPPRNGEPLPEQEQAKRRAKNKGKVRAQVTEAEGLDWESDAGQRRALVIRRLYNLDDNYDDIYGPPSGGVMGPPAPEGAPTDEFVGPPSGGVMGPPSGGAMGPPSGGAMGPPAPEAAAPGETPPSATDDLWKELDDEPETGFRPYEIEDSQETFGKSDQELTGIMITEAVEGGGTLDVPASTLLAMSRKRIRVLNQLGVCK